MQLVLALAKTRESGTGKINPVSYLFGALSVCGENKTKAFELANIRQCLNIKQDDLVLLTRDGC